ncbi:D-alanine--D-alanine ligase [Candidatus Neomarinimicrobiota bacterium]
MNIAVILGGINSERDVSMDSGLRIAEALVSLGHEVTPVVYEGDIGSMIGSVAEFDLVFNALHGGDGEDGTIQRALEESQIRYTGSRPSASQLAMDKLLSKQLMIETSVPTPSWVNINLEDAGDGLHLDDHPGLSSFLSAHSFPVVVKPNHEGSTVGLTIVDSPEDMTEALLIAREFGSSILVETYIPGRELTAAILDQKPLPLVEIVPKHATYDYECKYSDGMSDYFVPAELSSVTTTQIQEAALRIYNEIGCRHYARIDFRLNPEGAFFCLECNTLPGMTTHSLVPMAAKAVGINFSQLVEQIVSLAMQAAEGT